MCTVFSVSALRSACTSEFTAKKSTPDKAGLDHAVTALQPPPPTPITLIVAACSGTERSHVSHLIAASSVGKS